MGQIICEQYESSVICIRIYGTLISKIIHVWILIIRCENWRFIWCLIPLPKFIKNSSNCDETAVVLFLIIIKLHKCDINLCVLFSCVLSSLPEISGTASSAVQLTLVAPKPEDLRKVSAVCTDYHKYCPFSVNVRITIVHVWCATQTIPQFIALIRRS